MTTDPTTLRALAARDLSWDMHGDHGEDGPIESCADVRCVTIRALLDRLDALERALVTISEMSDATEQSSFREEAWAALDALPKEADR